MSISTHAEVVAKTTDITRDEWLEVRRSGIGGSDLASVLGESKWTSPLALYANKTGLVQSNDNTNEAMEWGNALELAVAQRVAKVYDAAVVSWPVVLRSRSNPFMLANLDFLIVEPSEDFPVGVVTEWNSEIEPPCEVVNILEIKTTGIVGRASREWEDDNVPLAYERQGNHYSIVTGIEGVVFAALVAGSGLQVRGRLYNSPEKNAWIVEKEREFWADCMNHVEPEPIGSDSDFDVIKSLYPKHEEGASIEADDFLLDTILAYSKMKTELDEAERRVKELRAKIELAIGANESLTHHGRLVATFKATKDGTTVDTKALAEAHPEIVAAFTKPKSGYRVLRIKEEK
jgi:putative phage-type endonuclease